MGGGLGRKVSSPLFPVSECRAPEDALREKGREQTGQQEQAESILWPRSRVQGAHRAQGLRAEKGQTWGLASNTTILPGCLPRGW